ncbi:hypothetical protein EYF80_019595 [Liparis tanakae]|uniref:Uncharacterized protein n=1 Tax=Liparis tanakae TaxID=230148 RepID=A0A4Z2HYZ7_9TELE|nr:hypothetical protein EYF80_019595 [Liparis tanakae]
MEISRRLALHSRRRVESRLFRGASAGARIDLHSKAYDVTGADYASSVAANRQSEGTYSGLGGVKNEPDVPNGIYFRAVPLRSVSGRGLANVDGKATDAIVGAWLPFAVCRSSRTDAPGSASAWMTAHQDECQVLERKRRPNEEEEVGADNTLRSSRGEERVRTVALIASRVAVFITPKICLSIDLRETAAALRQAAAAEWDLR